ncbi:lipoprotein [Spiroplasma clarkii]|uniref:lipoprotein n=1 Tax=Spiroplasma clarkii TaxID=2139 RepID=UPI0011BAA343|nr:lipoprotein [Spiroplasma clarkii]
MKKLLSIIGATTLITSTVASVAACSKSEMSIKVDSGWISKDSVSDITALALDKIAFPNIKKQLWESMEMNDEQKFTFLI